MILGIDTSCYTTSLAAIDAVSGLILEDRRRLLQVKPGDKGLRQSEAVFQHLKNLPELFSGETARDLKIKAVAAAVAPRPVPGSYLPVFKVGSSFGETFARLLGVPFIKTSHQEGHLRAGLYRQDRLMNRNFLAWHISGGTTELLLAEAGENGYRIQKIGGSSDLQVGQFIDRTGVALGTSFPAGPELENLARDSSSDQALPVATRGLTASFSGPDSAARRLLSSGIDKRDLARMVFNCIAKTLVEVSKEAAAKYKIQAVLLVGGVASSMLIREILTAEGPGAGIDFCFGVPELSSDNAVGIGLIGFDHFRKEKSND